MTDSQSAGSQICGKRPTADQPDESCASKPTRIVAGSVSQVLHVTSWLSRLGGGIPQVVWALARENTALGIKTTVAGLRDEWLEADCPAVGQQLITGTIRGPKSLGFTGDLHARLRAQAGAGSVVHSHGLWMYPGVVARKLARSLNRPLVISPHGMLEPWALHRSRPKKWVAARLFEDRNLQAADCLHALCAPEAANFRSYGLDAPIAVIPNGVDLGPLHPLPDHEAIVGRFPRIKSRRRILFLSRLHPKKGLENLLRAWHKLERDFDDWCVLIAGAGAPAYEEQLKSLVKELALQKSVVFLGPVYGEEKRTALAAADVFVLPSYSEGFSVAILEAAAAGLPVLLTPECNFPELAKTGAAIETSTDLPEIEFGLRTLLKLTDEQRSSMGRRGHDLVARAYSWPAIARQMLELYRWLSGDTPRPAFVQVR